MNKRAITLIYPDLKSDPSRLDRLNDRRGTLDYLRVAKSGRQ